VLGNPRNQIDSLPGSDNGPSRGPLAGHVPALDGLRGLAILLVLWNHFGPPTHPVPWHGLRLSLYNLSTAGWAGVDLFFVLSGFLITGNLLDARPSGVKGLPGEAGRAGKFFGHFYARRALRVFPLYYLVLTAVALMTALRHDPAQQQVWHDWSPWLWSYTSNLYNARNGWRAGPHGLLLNHFWTLAVEEQFYLVWPVVVYLCDRRVLLRGCLAAIGLAVALRYFCQVVQGNNYAAMLLMPCRIDAFAVGGALALVVRQTSSDGSLRAGACRPERAAGPSFTCVTRQSKIEATQATRSAQPGLARLGTCMAGAGALLLAVFCDYLWVDLIGRTILAVMFGGLVLLALSTRLGRFFELPVLRTFGRYSYGLYVLHFLLYRVIDRCFPADRFGTLGRFAGCTLVSLALAYASWQLVEKHCLKLKRWFPTGYSPLGDCDRPALTITRAGTAFVS
jgi:peptidoglycan/LPS O-acetylase OafA/YrhL